MKKYFTLFFVSLFFLASCVSFQTMLETNKPDVSVVKASLVEAGVRNATIGIVLNIKNNYKFNLPVEKVDIALDNLAGETFAKAYTVEPLTILSGSASDVTINTTISYQELFGTITSSVATKSISCKANMILYLNVNGIKLKIPYSKNFDIIK